jgi:hypothetical protein
MARQAAEEEEAAAWADAPASACADDDDDGQAGAAASAAYGTMSAFATEFGALLAGAAGVRGQRQQVQAYLQANSMSACLQLLAAAAGGAAAGGAAAGGADAASPAVCTGTASEGKSRPASHPAAANAGAVTAAGAVAAAGGACCMGVSVRDLLLGFGNGQEEAAFQLHKAVHLQQQDCWTAGLVVLSAAIGMLGVARSVSASNDPHAGTFFVCSCIWFVWLLLPVAVFSAARGVYLTHRGWLWGASMLLCGLNTTLTAEVMMARHAYVSLQAGLITRASAFVVMAFGVRPALMRLSFLHQLPASVGCALTTFYVSTGPVVGGYSPATCLALGAAAACVAALMELPDRRVWRARQAAALAASAAAAAAGSGAAAAASARPPLGPPAAAQASGHHH